MNPQNRIKGARNKAAGELFELACDNLFKRLRDEGKAHIQKTPEPMRVTGRTLKSGMFTAVFTKAAQPDYQGTMAGGRSVVLEAKFTDSDRITHDRISDLQAAELTEHQSMGAICAVLVCFSFEAYGLISWREWQRMKEITGRKHIKADDLERNGWRLTHYECNPACLAGSLAAALERLAQTE